MNDMISGRMFAVAAEQNLWTIAHAIQERDKAWEAVVADARRQHRESQELADRQRQMHYAIKARPILYTDEVGGSQTCRDDLWAVTTDELNEAHAWREKHAKLWAALRQVDCLLMENAGDTDEPDYLPGTTRAHDFITEALK